MADRFVLKQFAGSATNNGAFGAAQATGAGVQPVANIKDVQSLNAFEQGWNSATLTADKLPALEEMQGLEALLCKAIKENYSEGIPFWISGETYYQYSFVNYNGIIYYNTTGNYTANNPAIDTENWAAYNKVGTATVGTDDTPIYLNVGTPTAGKRMGVVAYDNTKTYNLNDVVLNVDSTGTVVLYLSLAANNTSALTDTTKWKKVSLGGGAGGEIGDMGFAPLGIDESLNLRRYLNGQVISQTQFVTFTTKVKSAVALFPNLGTTEANWQAEKLLSKFGQVGKFVIDDVNNTIRLPAVVNAQGLLSLSGIGNLVNESLPNITGTFGGSATTGNDVSGAFYKLTIPITSPTYGAGVAPPDYGMAGFDASRSSSTYQDDAPVQQEAVQYPYYIQVATGVEETLPAIREYKVNNSDFFGKSMYSENAPYNASWLASNGSYNASTLYPDFWTQLTGVELNGSLNVGDTIEISGKTYVKRGLPVVLSTGTITDYDFVVNQNDQTFRLPLLNGEENIPDYSMAYTLSNTGTITINKNGWINYTSIRTNSIGGVSISGVLYQSGSSATNDRGSIMIPVYKGDTVLGSGGADTISFIPAKGNGTLYYYVGDTVQDASLINAGAVLNTLSGKIGYDDLTTVHCVVETYQSGTSWYRVFDDGWVEQGGQTSSGSWTSVSFLKPFRDTNYTLTIGSFDPNTDTSLCSAAMTNKSASGVYLANYYSGTAYGHVEWQACGYGA